jgi:hypothetical protein
MAIAMSANGIFRELVLRRLATGALPDVLSAAIGIALIAMITRHGFRSIPGTASTSSLLALSAVLVVLTILFEFAVGRLVDRKPWEALIAHYELWHGELWPIVLAFLAATPFLWAQRQRKFRKVIE